MKIFQNPLIICLLLILTGACKKEEKDPFQGKFDYFTCKIDGVPFEPRGMHTCYGKQVSYYPRGTDQLNPGYFTTSATNCQSDLRTRVGFVIFVLNPEQRYYTVQEDSIRGHHSDITRPVFESDSAISGSVHFTTLIPQQYDEEGKRTDLGKVEGTFNFTLLTHEGDTVEITDGRFGFFKIQ